MEIKRIFDLLDYITENYPQDDTLNGKRKGQWVNFSTKDYYKFSLLLSYGLYHLGLHKGDKVVTITNNRPEFNIMDMAMSMLGIVHVPIYPTLSSEDYKYIINHSDAKMLVIGNRQIYARVKPVFDSLNLEFGIYTLDKIEDETELNEVLRQGIFHRKEYAPIVEDIKKGISEDDIATMIYTSGTTGTPKGVMLTHKNLISNFIAHAHVQPLNHTHRALSFLPLCHIYERSLNYHYQYLGVSIYYAESLGTIATDIADIKANGFCAVPRVLEMIFDKLYAAGKDLPLLKKWIYFAAIKHGYRYDYHKNVWYRLQNKIYDTLVYSKWRKKFGGSPWFSIITGGSAIQPKIIRLFSAANMFIYEGYGMSETSPVIAVNNPNGKRYKIGTVGPILAGVQVKFSDDGEILTKGPCLMKGYYKDPEYTAKVIDEDGWFHTGDIGHLVDGEYLQITDRKKEIFKLSAGKYVAPQMLENLFKESPFIDNLMVIGENEKFTSAIISPNFNHLHFWASKHKVHFQDNAELITLPPIVEHMQKEVEKYNKNLSQHEKIKCFRMVEDVWSVQTGELSPILKPKRAILYKKYESIVNEIYNKGKENENNGFSIKQINLTDVHLPEFMRRLFSPSEGSETKSVSAKMDTIQVHDKVFRKYIDNSDIQLAAQRIARAIDKDYGQDIPILVNILEGSTMFMTDLMNYITIPVEICSVKCTSYNGLDSTQEIKQYLDITRDVANRRIIIVEDIVDSGLTIEHLYKYFQSLQVKDIRIVAMTIKHDNYHGNIPVDYEGIAVDNKFVVGHGMDYNQLGRNYKHIYRLDE